MKDSEHLGTLAWRHACHIHQHSHVLVSLCSARRIQMKSDFRGTVSLEIHLKPDRSPDMRAAVGTALHSRCRHVESV